MIRPRWTLMDQPGIAARFDDSHWALVPTTTSASRISSLILNLNLACLIALTSASYFKPPISPDFIVDFEPNKSFSRPAMGASSCFIKQNLAIPA